MYANPWPAVKGVARWALALARGEAGVVSSGSDSRSVEA